MTKEMLFVYGTLRKGFLRHRLLSGQTRFVGTGRIHGVLYDLGAYPGVVGSEEGEVQGELYEFESGSELLRMLDRVESFDPLNPQRSLFVRSITDVKLDNDEILQAWVYFLPAKPSRARVIAGGDYRAFSSR